jgi:ubiquinone biosynthesis protein UbiJ
VATALLTEAWLTECNTALESAPGIDEGRRPLIVTELVPDAPDGAHRAVTLIADHEGVRLVAGEWPGASAWLTVSMADAGALHAGQLDPARALTEGRVRVRGDLSAVVELVAVLADAHSRLRAR